MERVSPGDILFNPVHVVDQFSYDSSTWGGNSGSPVVSLVDGSVVGLHFEGIGGNLAGAADNNAIVMSRILPVLQAHGVL